MPSNLVPSARQTDSKNTQPIWQSEPTTKKLEKTGLDLEEDDVGKTDHDEHLDKSHQDEHLGNSRQHPRRASHQHPPRAPLAPHIARILGAVVVG